MTLIGSALLVLTVTQSLMIGHCDTVGDYIDSPSGNVRKSRELHSSVFDHLTSQESLAMESDSVAVKGGLASPMSLLIGHRLNVSGVLTIEGLALTCPEEIKQLATKLCLPNKTGEHLHHISGHRVSKRRMATTTTSAELDSILDSESMPLEMRRIVMGGGRRSKRSQPFDKKLIQARIQQLIGECCSGEQKCTRAHVREQIEDGCRPGRMSGSRNVLNA